MYKVRLTQAHSPSLSEGGLGDGINKKGVRQPRLVQYKHNTIHLCGLRVVLIFVIMRVQRSDGSPLELRVRNKNCQPHSCYKDSIKQVVPFLNGWARPPIQKSRSCHSPK